MSGALRVVADVDRACREGGTTASRSALGRSAGLCTTSGPSARCGSRRHRRRAPIPASSGPRRELPPVTLPKLCRDAAHVVGLHGGPDGPLHRTRKSRARCWISTSTPRPVVARREMLKWGREAPIRLSWKMRRTTVRRCARGVRGGRDRRADPDPLKLYVRAIGTAGPDAGRGALSCTAQDEGDEVARRRLSSRTSGW
jgi:hypothetical protein